MSNPPRKGAMTSPPIQPAKAKRAAKARRQDVGKPFPNRGRQAGDVRVSVGGVAVEVSPELEAAVRRAYEGLREPMPEEMTTTQAAAFLDVSRPFLVKLVRRGELPCRMVGKHRRIPGAALRDYRAKMFRRAKDAADEMVRLAEESGLNEVQGMVPTVR